MVSDFVLGSYVLASKPKTKPDPALRRTQMGIVTIQTERGGGGKAPGNERGASGLLTGPWPRGLLKSWMGRYAHAKERTVRLGSTGTPQFPVR